MTAVTEPMLRALLAEHPNLDMDEIKVCVQDSRVVLSGRVRTQRESDEAEAIVREAPGVQKVTNKLTVTGEPI